MNSKFVKVNFFIFVITYLFLSLVLTLFIYKILIKDFIELENTQNYKNVNTILSKTDLTISNIKAIIGDYAKWDDTYEYLKTNNKEYIHENFREGTNTLEELKLDFIIFATKENKVLYSDFLKKENTRNLEKDIIEKFKKETLASSLYKYSNSFYYIVKEEVLKSDSTGVSSGYIIGGKYVNSKSLEKFSGLFDDINIYSSKYYEKIDLKQSLSNGNIVTVKYGYIDDNIVNTIQFFDLYDNYIFSIKAINKRVIVDKGKGTIIILSSVISLILFILMYVLYKRQNFIEKYNQTLELKVNRRTKQLEKTLISLKEKNRRLSKISNTDSLTKISNRRSFFKESKKLLKEAIDNNKELNILLIDIDYFKKINDTYGHSVGDEVLKEFVKIVNSIIDKNVIFGRIGGEEFCLTFLDITFENVLKISEQIRKEIENSVLKIDNNEIKFTISLGLANKKDYKHIDEILVIADEYLYKAKNTGRNRLVRDTKRV